MLFQISIILLFLVISNASIFELQAKHPLGYHILDLVVSDLEVEAMAEEWKVTNFLTTRPYDATLCHSNGISFCLGGYEISPPLGTTASLSRIYSNLPPHFYATVFFQLLLIDDWPSSDPPFLQIDDWTSVLAIPTAIPISFYSIGDAAGGENILLAFAKIKHSKDSLTLKISGSPSSKSFSSTSFSIRSVLIFLYSEFSGTFTQSLVNKVHIACQPNTCPGSGVCFSSVAVGSCPGCPVGCGSCAQEDPSQCFTCLPEYSFDGERCSSCHTDCFQCLNVNECIKCNTGKVLDLDKTCQTSCSGGSIPIGGVNFKTCVKPCSSGQYLLWNYTCANSCDSPLVITRGTAVGDFCDFPCSSVEYLYWNGSCLESCPSEDTRIEIDKKFCNKPALSPEEVKEIQNIAEVGSKAGTVASVGLAITSFFSVGNPVRILSGSLKQMLEYTRYLNITHSAKLARLFNVSDTSSMSIFPEIEMNEELKGKFTLQRLPYMFEKFEIQSSFFVNFWDNLFQYCILIGCLALLIALDLSCRGLRNIGRAHLWIKRGKVIMINYIIGQYYQEVGTIVFYTGLEFYAVDKPESGYSYLSFLTPIACLLIGAIIFTVNWKFVQKYHRIRSMQERSVKDISKELVTLKIKYQSLEILYEEFQDISRSHQAYLMILQSRSILFNIVIVFLSHSPHVQVFLIILTHFIILGYFAIKRPLKSTLNLMQQTLFELCLLVVNLSWLVMAIIDRKENIQSGLRDFLSDVVINMNLVFTFIPIGFLALQIALFLKQGFQFLQEKRTRRKVQATKVETSLQEKSELVQNSSMMTLPKNHHRSLFLPTPNKLDN